MCDNGQRVNSDCGGGDGVSGEIVSRPDLRSAKKRETSVAGHVEGRSETGHTGLFLGGDRGNKLDTYNYYSGEGF